MAQPIGATAHWQAVYDRTEPRSVSWYQDEPATSLRLLSAAGTRPGSSVIDVGGGASTLVDALLERGVTDVTVLDVAESALGVARRRLGDRAGVAHWMARDLLTWSPLRRYGVWHDRAVFHFLTAPADRDRYRRVLEAALAPHGQAVLGVFAPDGPQTCSGLPVARYDAQELAAQFPGFQVEQVEREEHHTPAGHVQPFTWLRLRRAEQHGATWAPAPAPQPGRVV
ncbi:class I SAM-dependent methyltransferase [Catellatospora tritici]|uniref:class I SAM-dependent methyltransferase n=1 Tax=Catellatospora tritici TaxID=2851566 RepID=UPI001C2CE35F|nr:class I SAM-dependent methyltransferase [Catellatospora tritici]MBV1851808.1 class I SAM-dependent methyltransferase [Catellatospora tritici]